MAVDSYGDRGQPHFSDSGAPDIAVDPTAVADYAAEVGTRRVGSRAGRTALSGAKRYNGLRYGETDYEQGDWIYYDGWYDEHDLSAAIGPIARYTNAGPDDKNSGTSGEVRGTVVNSPRVRRVLVVVNYVWVAGANAAGNDEIRIGGNTYETSTSITGVVREENLVGSDGAPVSTPVKATLTGTVTLQKGNNRISLFGSADALSALRKFRNITITLFAL